MVECNKEEAFRAREVAIKKMETNDFVAAWESLLVAQRIFPELEGISHLLTICNVHCAAESRVRGEMDWYGIFQVEAEVNGTTISQQYLNLTRLLDTDKHRFPGAEAAFKLVAEAYSVLNEPMKRFIYDVKTNRNSFWTKCPLWTKCPCCKTDHQYYLSMLNNKVDCQRCQRRFIASNLKEQPTHTLSIQSQQGHHLKPPAGRFTGVEVQVSAQIQDKSSVLIKNENMHVRPMRDPADPNVGSSAKHYSTGGTVDGEPNADQSAFLHEEFGIPMENNSTRGKSMPYPADPMVVDTDNLGWEEASEVLSAVVETSKRKQDAGGNTSVNSDSNKVQRSNDSPSAHFDTICNQISDDDATSFDRQPASPTLVSSEPRTKKNRKTTGTFHEQDTTLQLQERTHGADRFSNANLSPTIYTYPDPEFHIFEEDRSCAKLKPGQIWALYTDVDMLPKFYAWINRVELDPFTVHLFWLEAYPQQEHEKRWLEKQISMSCGTFRVLDEGAKFNTTDVFSHLVMGVKETGVPRQLEILPQVGEVWAVYKNWAPDWTPSISACEFAVGEVIERTEDSTTLWFFSKVDGYVTVFKPEEEEENAVLEIPARENSRFSHRIPCFCLTGEMGGMLCGFYELDPASVPNDLLSRNITCVQLDSSA